MVLYLWILILYFHMDYPHNRYYAFRQNFLWMIKALKNIFERAIEEIEEEIENGR